MDALDKLKGAWKSQDYSQHKVSSNDIVKMLHAKSSSYVKWIFYISIIEFTLVMALNLYFETDNKYMDIYDKMGMHTMITVLSAFSYLIMIVFIYLFYQNYKKINVDASAKTLMQNIINTRKTVRLYIYFNIGGMAIASFIIFYTIFSSPEKTAIYKLTNDIPDELSTKTFAISIIVVMIIMIGLILLIYRIIYGILLRRLKKNYKELKQLDN